MASLKIALKTDSENPVVGDLYLENGTFRMTNSLSEEVAQQLWIRFKFFLGEWFLDRSQGFPWFQSVLGVKTPIGIVNQLIRRLILGVPGVAELKTFSLVNDTATRTASVRFTVVLTDGVALTSADFAPFVIGAV
jgi:hypothetical protein